jgi:hypothetical protein
VSPVLQYLLDGAPNLCIEVPFEIEGLRAFIERRMRRWSFNSMPLT